MLKKEEKIWLYITVIFGSLLFVGGVFFSFYIALPPALDFLLNFGSGLAEPNIRIGSYIDFVTRLLFWTGISFETPLLIMFLARFRIVSASQLLRWWRVAIVFAFIASAIITPTIDPVTQSLIAGPIILLYFAGVVLAWIVHPGRNNNNGGEIGLFVDYQKMVMLLSERIPRLFRFGCLLNE